MHAIFYSYFSSAILYLHNLIIIGSTAIGLANIVHISMYTLLECKTFVIIAQKLTIFH